MCNDKIKFTHFAIIVNDRWNEIIKVINMKTQPNPALKNTAIFVGNDTELRKKAIEYYESEGYPFEQYRSSLEFIATFDDNSAVSDFNKSTIKSYGYKIITLPNEPKSEYPKWMLVSDDNEEWGERLVICGFKGRYVAVNDDESFDYWEYAKDIPTVTLTQSELIEAYEKSNNVKVIIK